MDLDPGSMWCLGCANPHSQAGGSEASAGSSAHDVGVSNSGAATEITPVASSGGGNDDADGGEAGADDAASSGGGGGDAGGDEAGAEDVASGGVAGGKKRRRRLKHAPAEASQRQRQDAAART